MLMKKFVEKALSSGKPKLLKLVELKRTSSYEFDLTSLQKNQSRYERTSKVILWLRTYMINSKLFPIHVLF